MNYSKYPSPCYILSEEALLANLQLLDLVQKEAGVRIICALKGYAFWPSFPLIREWLSGATASSVNEARLIAEEMGCEAHTYAPVYTDQDFEQLLMYSSHLTFNSLGQYHRFREQAAAFPKKVSLGLRINPEYSEIETDLYNPAVPVRDWASFVTICPTHCRKTLRVCTFTCSAKTTAMPSSAA